MDSLITAAALALAAGDPLGALNRIALRDDPPALALRGIAMARLGDFARATALLKLAARGFGAKEAVARARCIVAEAEIALVSRDLAWPTKSLEAARATLEQRGDWLNAAHARNLQARRLILIGRLDDAEQALAVLDPSPFPPAARAVYELVVAGLAIRRIHAEAARDALARAERAARHAGIPELIAEVRTASRALTEPAARLTAGGETTLIRLAEVETILASGALVVDACRRTVRGGHTIVPLARRPVLFALAKALGEAWPGDVSRRTLIARAFRGKDADDSHRARLRVEIGRLRAALRRLADIGATPDGFALTPHHNRKVAVLTPPVDDPDADVMALLADGEAWSSSALAIALDTSQRTVQRALDTLAEAGTVQSHGRGRARRWTMPPIAGFTTTLLLPAPLPDG
jgi:hypothetical protein